MFYFIWSFKPPQAWRVGYLGWKLLFYLRKSRFGFLISFYDYFGSNYFFNGFSCGYRQSEKLLIISWAIGLKISFLFDS